MEMTGFGFGGISGLLVGKGAVGAATYLTTIGLISGPVGWAVIIGVGIAAGFGAAYYGDKFGKGFASMLWDRGR